MSDSRPRRTFAVISHPDAGKSTLTEALALHARVITEAGAVHGKGGRRATVSDWMDMEKARGISITSAALQFVYRDHVVNLVDTPGHSDFSEDTYRVLSAVDSAVMLVDAGKGLEPQTLKLFKVCALRGIPVITVINKWDRPGLSALELMDLIEQQIKLRPTPLTWPVGEAGDFRGVLDRRTGEFVKYTRTAGGATRAPELRMPAAEVGDERRRGLGRRGRGARAALGRRRRPRPGALPGRRDDAGHVRLRPAELRRRAAARPAARPRPGARHDRRASTASVRDVDDEFSAFVFKVQSGMNAAHRDRLAYARIVSGDFERGMVVTHAATGRPFATKYAQAVFGRELTSIEHAYPGDIIGFVNAQALRVGDTVYVGDADRVPAGADLRPRALHDRDRDRHRPLQAVPPRHRAARPGGRRPGAALRPARRPEPGARRGRPDAVRGRAGADGQRVQLADPALAGSTTRWLAVPTPTGARALSGVRGVEVLQRSDGTQLALFIDQWRANATARDNPDVLLEALPAGGG